MVMAHIGGNSMSRLGPTGLAQLLTNIKTWVTTKLGNYVTTNTTQTITGKKLFTNAAIQLDSIVSMSGSTMFIDTSAAAPRGEFPAEAHRVGRIYIGDNASYNGSWFIVDPTIDTNKAYYRMVTTNPDNTDSTRFSITWDSTKEGARCRKNVSQGDLLPSGNNTYNLGADDLKWDIGYIHNLIGSNKENASEDANGYYSTTSGSHMTFYTTTNGGTKLSNVPSAVNTQLESRTIRYLSASDWNVEQICHNTNGLYYRKGNNNGWGDWKTFAFTDSNITGTAANVTGTVAIANGGTGATTRLNAVKNLTNESVGTPTHFLAITTNYAKAGYTTVAQAKTVLGITGDIVSHNASEFLTTSGNETVTGTKIFNGDKIVITQGNGYRMVCNTDGGASGYGVFQRVDSANWYLMVTAQNDALGSWTSARPASMNLSTGVLSINGNAATATQFSANTTVALTGDATGTSAGSKKGWSIPVTLANSGVTAGTYGPSEDVTGNNNTTISVPQITVDAKGRVTSVTNRTLTCKNNTYNVYDKMLTIQKNGTNVATFTSNSNTDVTANITVPTKVSELTNDSGYLTSHQSLSNYVTIDTAQDIEGNKNFKGLLTTIPNDTIWPVTASTTDDITYLGANAIHVEQKSSGKLTDLSNGAWSVAELGVGCFFFRINNGADIRYKNFAQNTVNRIPVVSGANRFINDVTPNEDNTYSLGTSSLRWSSCYCNAYYLGTTAFGDIVTHNASEFLASNGKAVEANKVQATIDAGTTAALVQATVASNDCFRIAAGGAANAGWAEIATGDDANEPIYVRQYKGAFTTLQRTATLLDGSGNTSFPGTVTATGFSGPLTGDVTGNASSATEFSANKDVTLTGDVTGTASSKAGWSVATTLANSGVTAGDYGPSEDASPAHSGTFTVPSITVDAKGRITAASTKTITLPADNNTDTKVTQTVTTANSGYPVLLCATANATATGTTTSRFSAGLTVNARYSAIYMTNKYDTANTKGVRNTSNYSNGILYFRSYDDTQMGTIRCESNKGGYQQIYMQASNYIKNGAIDPEGTSTTCLITVRVRDNGGKAIYTDGSWENSLTPYANNTYSLGTSSLQWKNAYAVNIYENGTALSSKYAQVDNISANGIGTTRLLAYFPANTTDLSLMTSETKSGTNLYVVYWRLESTASVSGDVYTDSQSSLVVDKSRAATGTWKLLHSMSQGVTSKAMIGVWVRTA